MSRQKGRVFQISPEGLFSCATHLGEAIHKLGIQQRIQGGDGRTYGTDIGEIVGCVAFALAMLGFTTEASAGGFGKPPTITVGHPMDETPEVLTTHELQLLRVLVRQAMAEKRTDPDDGDVLVQKLDNLNTRTTA